MTEHQGGALRFIPTPSEDQAQLAEMFPVGSALMVYGECRVCGSSRSPEQAEEICVECWAAYVQ